MWTYRQSDGFISDAHGIRIAQGYSGAGPGKNNPTMQSISDVGPCPEGLYIFNPPVDTVTHGPYVLQLEPAPSNQMYGRAGFLIHGDSVVEPGTASKGCIILPRFARERMWESGDHELQVVSGLPVVTDPEIAM